MAKIKRKSISKKIRFEVFKRDSFTCQYCGGTPPDVTLEIDHIQPVSKKGTNEINNLLTSCFDCNRGKGKTELKTIPSSLSENIEVIKESELQYKEFKKLLKKVSERVKKEINEIDDVYNSYFENHVLTDNFKQNSIKMFLNKLNFYEVKESMEMACSRFRGDGANYHSNSSGDAIKYFCGICWNKINDKK